MRLAISVIISFIISVNCLFAQLEKTLTDHKGIIVNSKHDISGLKKFVKQNQSFQVTDKGVYLNTIQFEHRGKYFFQYDPPFVVLSNGNYSLEQCWEKISAIKIHHVNGSLGLLPLSNSEENLTYGKTQRLNDYLKRSRELKIIPELREEEGVSDLYKQALTTAQQIYFISFACDKLNLKVPGYPLYTGHYVLQIYCTVYKMIRGEIEAAVQRVGVKTKNRTKHLKPYFPDCDDYTFFREEFIKSFT